MISAQSECLRMIQPHGIQGQRRGDYTVTNMSFEGETIKQQNCKSCNIRYEQKDAHLGYIVETEGFRFQCSGVSNRVPRFSIDHPAS